MFAAAVLSQLYYTRSFAFCFYAASPCVQYLDKTPFEKIATFDFQRAFRYFVGRRSEPRLPTAVDPSSRFELHMYSGVLYLCRRSDLSVLIKRSWEAYV